ncbi:hypothetical protein JTE90_002804 [Oedothorax gibbosus]|uniref:EGF-like domain-containing protein n=1 Tax=Oedothorax gibbosus TaxID=931172 RepID=A0AAV6UG92_9ARAC|nr:hypothetical protein JTE90_002804 [Oedothorax gibbosus]
MWSVTLIVACVILQSGFRPTHCSSKSCDENERYVDNVNPCNDCQDWEGACQASGETGPGCDCIEGYLRNEEGKCVEKSACFGDGHSDENGMVHLQTSHGEMSLPKRTKRTSPVHPDVQETSPVRPIPYYPCRDDEEFQACGCLRTCCNKGRNEHCGAQCSTGCFCKPPLVRNDKGGCVRLEDCNKGNQTEQCGTNEVYNECGTACPKTCKNRNYQIKCIAKCVKGCFCEEGYVRNDKGKCVKPYQCPSDTCGANEVYKDCGTACPKTCANRNIKIRCIDECVEGCFCKDGYVRNDEGICVKPNQCPEDVCGINEVYKDCGTACPKTCANRNIKIACIDKCVEGCFCKDGYVRNDEGICVKPSQCPAETCGDREEYTDCGTACPLTCDNMDDPPFCTLQCVPGCFCEPGLVRNSEGKCVEPYECPADVCGANEVFKECGTACPKTCDNRNVEIACIDKCVEGCFCKDGFVRNDEGACVKPHQCPAETCDGEGEEYSDCGSACPLTCANKDNPPICILSCQQGCFCKRGLVRDEFGRCVEPEQCPPVVVTIPPIDECDKDKQFYECMPTCHRTCDALTRKTKIYCTQICKSGCFCREGLYQTRDGKCVPPEECSTPTKQPDVCGKHEVFKTCGTACPQTCSTLDKTTNRVCTRQCVRGCFCQDGYVKNDQGVCVRPKDCSKPTKPPQCGRDEQFYDCIPDCKQTCEAYADKEIRACKTLCRPGCYCKKGLYKRKDGKCVKPSQCDTPTKQPETCPKNEVYSTCVNPCNDCQIRGKCQFLVCNKGCDCKKGYHRDGSGKCIPASQCPGKNECGRNEEYKTCGTACQVTCSNRFLKVLCIDKCVEGCFCKEGYIRNDEGKCIEPSQCPVDTCPINEEYSDCVIPCNDCETKGDCEFLLCNEGCDCKPGFYRDSSGTCIPESQCPIKEICLIEGEEYNNCGSACPLTCSNQDDPPPCTKQCVPGCFCSPGLVRNDEGRCVEPYQCPPKEICLIEGEEYTDCGSACPLTCSNKDDPPPCTKQCVPGCFCKPGLVRNEEGRCVEPTKCPPTNVCPKNEEYSDCVIPCNTCKIKGQCEFLVCNEGCDCIYGYYRDASGKCIKESQCPVAPTLPPYQECGADEQYYDCIPSCQNTCFVYTSEFPIACKMPCKAGCFCKEGLYQTDDGKCVPPNKCPRPTKQPGLCGINEIFLTCGTACPATCANRKETNRVCTLQCVEGCFCKKGYVRNDLGLCVKPSECPPEEVCGINEAISDCAKPKTCNTCEIRGNCKLKRCTRGCDCLEGYYRDSTGVCIPASQCPVTCPVNEEYTDCVIPCNDCETKGDCDFLVCNKGCDCKRGYYRDQNGKCIPESQCPITETCQLEGEEYTDCGSACPLTCDNKDNPPICTLQCVAGCFCRKGLIRNNVGRCVDPGKCPPKETCLLKEEEYNDCGTACPLTCANKDNPPPCVPLCVPGCFCRPGLVRNDEGQCVEPQKCPIVPTLPPNNCGKDEQFYECMPTCHGTCDSLTGPRSYCSQICKSGCFCKEGLYKRKDGKCVPRDECTPPTVPTTPPGTCGVNEQYYRCVPTCKNTCENYKSRHPRCTRVCKQGCACKKGYVRRKDGKCVKPSQCDEPTKPTIPPTQKCGRNEEFYRCVPTCKNTCENLLSQVCPVSPCRSGCFCRKGLVKRKDGKCVKPVECSKPAKPTKPTHTCGTDEQYYRCVPTCKHTCDNYNDRRPRCSRTCRPGCYCKKGLVKRQDGKCVTPSDCDKPTKPPTETCGKDEQYYQCTPDCKNTCANYNRPHVACPKICRRGCFCKEGLVKREDGKCVRPSECNTPTKPPTCDRKKHEQYYKCTPDCKNTCENYDNPATICLAICKSGCFCKEGYVKRKDGKCVKPSQCETPTKPTKPPICDRRKNEQYYECTPDCKNTCENYDNPAAICPYVCKSGCFCREGYVKRKDGKCVKPSQCEAPTKPTKPPTCDRRKNEQFYECTPDCKNTCENYDNPSTVCPYVCKRGCFCKEGYVKRKDGKCVKPSQCEAPTKPTKPPTCGVNEEYSGCIPTCRNTCENYNDKNPICSKICIQGCHCKKGYVKRKDGKCVRPSQCDEPTRPTKPPTCDRRKNEQYYECTPDCKNTCENYDNPATICPTICKSGCFCRKGYVKRKDGKCVKPSQCEAPTKPTKPPTCGVNEEYSGCIPTCRNTCENYNAEHPICSKICIRGCHCKKGYVKRKDGKCVRPSQCDEPTRPTKPPTCDRRKNEQYYECTPDCKNTCENYNRPDVICTAICKSGCFCRKGYVKRKDGKCVRPSQCGVTTKPTKPPTCDRRKNEQYYECTPDCKNTCENYDNPATICPAICKSGCFCRKGYVKRKDGKCVRPSQCGKTTKPTKPPHNTCGKNEKYYSCVPTCKNTCENYDDKHPICPLYCRAGCACKEGYVKNRQGKCVKPSQCQEPTKPTKPPHNTCGKNEKYYNCVPTCRDTCDNYDDKHAICTKICRPGCACKEGYVKNKHGKCVEPSQCEEPTKPTKPPHHTCGKNEKYYNCVPTCKDTCENYDDEHPICPLYCRAGCACKEGYVKNKQGKCVKPSQCHEPTKATKPPHHTCGKHEKYYNCIPTCKNTCENYDDEYPICTLICLPGCACEEGYVKNKQGKCVKPSQCQEPTKPTKPPHNSCGQNEKYYNCVPTCRDTCDNYDDKHAICTKICRPGCACKEGYVKNKQGKCVKPSQCQEPTKATKPPHNTCGKNEEYYNCVPTCRDTCDNYYDKHAICTKICRPGCACKKGYVKNKQGKCVKPSQCEEPTKATKPPHHTCGKNEKYYNCVPTCRDTCDSYNDKHAICTKICRPGCACKEGYVKNKQGKCVKPSQCEEPTKPTKPPHNTCGKNEKYYSCVPTCRDTCDNYDDKHAICTLICRPGCACKEGYVKNKQGKCVKPSQCPEPTKPTKPPHHTCGKNEKYYNCVPTCKDTCENYDDEHPICPLFCRAGCACIEGYVKNKQGKCVKPSQCQEPTKPTKPSTHCGPDEVYYDDCAPSCGGTCDTYGGGIRHCPLCRPGCWCKKGYVKNKEGKCIKPSKCPAKPTKPPTHTCGADEKYYKCVPTCRDTCENYDDDYALCPEYCRPGCACKEGLVKRKDGKCVKPSKCHEPTKPTGTPKPTHKPTNKPHSCPKYEEYYSDCAPSCQGSCDTLHLDSAECPKCKPGCWCKRGLVKNKNGKCVPPIKCRDTKPTKPSRVCGKEEIYYDECAPSCHGTCDTLNRHNIFCIKCKPGCWCKKGYVKNSKGKCIPSSECPKATPPTSKGGCGKHKEFYECYNSCQNSCASRNRKNLACPAVCERGCFCKKGLLTNGKGRCVKPEECDKSGSGEWSESSSSSEEDSREEWSHKHHHHHEKHEHHEGGGHPKGINNF